LTSGAASVHQSLIERFAAGDLVTPIEELREATVVLFEHIDAIDPTDEPDGRVVEMHSRLEPYLARVICLADHGGARGSGVVISEIAAIACEAGERRDQPSADPLLPLALHCTIWTLSAYALAHDRTDIPAHLAGVEIPRIYSDAAEVAFESVELRHNDLFDRDAFKVYLSLRDWLANSELRDVVPRWRRERDFELALDEAELWAALRFSYGHEDTTWTPVIGRGDSAAMRRLRARFKSSEARRDLAMLLGSTEDRVAEALNTSYARLTGPDRWTARGQLIPTD
jgi:hypothetical protein